MLMLTAYLDESGHEGKDLVILAGFLGTDPQWAKCETDWKSVLEQRQRKHLHMKRLYWSKPASVGKLLTELGPIPHAAGLQAVFSAVKVADYEDIVDGTLMQKLIKGYVITLLGVVDVISKHIPEDEPFKLVLEVQREYAAAAYQIYLGSGDRRTPDGRRKWVSLEYIGKDESVLAEPADFLAYAQVQQYRDINSVRSKLCEPILKNTRPALARNHLVEKDNLRQFVKGMVAKYPNLMQSA
jgi:hypothetical protein